jgi:uncharacterized protein (TIGR02145 family)
MFLASSCIKERLPRVKTLPITDTTWSYAVCGGEVIDEGSSPVTERGVCVSTRNPPDIVRNNESNYTNDSSGFGSFKSTIYYVGTGTKIIPATRYIRAYATNKYGTSYGAVLTCLPKYKPAGFVTMNLAGVSSTSASFNVDVGVIDAPAPSELDLCYSTKPSPTIDGDHISIFNLNKYIISNLFPNTTYYVRGYVKNSGGYAYSPEISFTTWEGEITDKSGNTYQIKTLGNHIWTIRNLETTKFDDGSDIPVIQDDILWGSTISSAYCKYTDYGKLYNYYAVADSRKLCPTGWHVSSDSDWKELEISLGMSQDQADASGLRGTVEGGMLKSASLFDGWNSPNIGATNSSGFTAYGSGYRSDNGIFNNQNTSSNIWTDTQYNAETAWGRSLSVSNAQIIRLNINKGYGLSVRCVRDNK